MAISVLDFSLNFCCFIFLEILEILLKLQSLLEISEIFVVFLIKLQKKQAYCFWQFQEKWNQNDKNWACPKMEIYNWISLELFKSLSNCALSGIHKKKRLFFSTENRHLLGTKITKKKCSNNHFLENFKCYSHHWFAQKKNVRR